MQKRTINSTPILNNKANTLLTELYYEKGGWNLFTGVNEVRGLYLSVTPVEIVEYEGGGRSVGFTAFSGTKKLVKELKRFSQKQLDSFVVDDADVKQLTKHVIEKNKLEVELK